MSDSEDFTVTYTEVSSPLEDLSDIGSSGVIIHGYDGLPMMPEDPYAYVKTALQAPPSPDYFMPPEDDVLPAEDQPLPAAVSPTADSPSYITKSDLGEDLEEDDKDPEEDPADYPTDRDDDDDEEEEESSREDAVAMSRGGEGGCGSRRWYDNYAVPPPVCRTTARMFIRDQTPIPFLSATEVDRFLVISIPLPSPLTSYSSPLPQIPSPPLPVSSPLSMSPPPLPVSPTHPLGYRAAMIRLRAESPSTSHPLPLPPPITPPSGTPPLLPIPLPTSSPPLLLPSTDYRADAIEVTLSPQKRLCIALDPRYKVGESSSTPTARPTRGFRAYYCFVGTLDAEIRRDPEREIELGQRMTNFVMSVRQDTEEIYGRLDDAHDDRSLMSGQLNLLRRDRRAHARTARLMEAEAKASREAWVQSMDASDTAHSETQMVALQSKQTPAKDPAHPDVPEEADRVADVLAEHEATKSENGKDSHDSGMGVRRQAPLARECTYPDFMKCKPLYFKGTKGVFELTQWFERMETVFRISNCTVENQIKFATCTLLESALTWWNSYVRTVGHDVTYSMTWTNLKKMMTDKYCPRGEIKKLEVKMWNLKVEESNKIKRYVGGLPDMIHRSVMASKPKTMQDAIEFATELMDKKIHTFAECQSENKRKQDDN
ncbi:putative reverse transcriptase domain-containing protein [Tanacetum coccineum]